MKDSFAGSLHRRELSDGAIRSSRHKLYSARRLVRDLDIVNELDGHSGCVNALSWSKSGRLLASGSDDQHMNIYRYQPENEGQQFQLQATVATGHTQNIFSVKFMPHSNDSTLITASGDAQVRIFDLEYAGSAGATSAASALATEGRRRGRNSLFNGVRYLGDGDTNAKVYRSHGDRVKRIITESSPHLFLTCSEDGEVRQWDLRQPSSTYPEPRGSRMFHDPSVPPPLISYKRYSLDLNTISCSASQPHYIALGGAHLHAFLHDRRMCGRDKLKEMGRPLSASSLSPDEQELLGQATQCVHKFAPKGQKKMKRTESGHITACKISDARPDELLVSWSGDHIYAFDLVRDTVSETDQRRSPQACRVRESADRKRKRKVNDSEISLSQAATKARVETEANEDTSLRVHYNNGQSEDIALPSRSPLSVRQTNAQQIARATVKLQSALFGRNEGSTDPSAQFTNALGQAARLLGDIETTIREWGTISPKEPEVTTHVEHTDIVSGYPMLPQPSEIRIQQLFRSNRERTRRYTQAAGTLARVLGGKLQTSSESSALLAKFVKIDVRNNEVDLSFKERFCYDFLKAILVWIDSGVGQLVEAFTRPSDSAIGSKAGNRLPIPEADATVEAIDEYLIPYLLAFADDEPIVNVEANRFETEDNRQLFTTEGDAVRAFAAAVRIPFADLSAMAVQTDETEQIRAQDRQTALKFWARKVGLGLLLNAADGLNSLVVDRSFGGIGRMVPELAAEEALVDLLGGVQDEEDETFAAVELIDESGNVVDGAHAEDVTSAAIGSRHATGEGSSANQVTISDNDDDDDELDGDDDSQSSEDDDDDDDASDESSEPDEEDGVPAIGVSRYIYRSAFERRRLRSKVEADVSCSRPTRVYQGHCNVRTVKDVNYFGPNDEYVVSGSDDGNFFIWDRKTAELVNILEGDGEVVNVIQGHPYETMLAVSGIDHTIKIFSPDGRARQIARLGQQGVSAHDASSFSSLAWPHRMNHRRQRRTAPGEGSTSEPAMPASANEDISEDELCVAANGLQSRKRMDRASQIMRSNETERSGGNPDTVMTIPRAQLLQLLFGQLGNVGFDFE